MQLAPLADRMRFLKNTEKGKTEISSVIKQYARQEAENVKHATIADVARKLLDTGKLTPQEVAYSTGLSIEDIYELCEPQQV